jgi:hypothetical protein
MGKEKENIKGIFEGIYTGKGKFKDGTEFWFVSSKEVKSYKVNELLTNANDGNELPNMISKEYKKVFEETYHKQASEQQSKFAFDVTKLMCSDLIDNKPVLVPARAGFGKTTLIRTFLEGKILECK